MYRDLSSDDDSDQSDEDDDVAAAAAAAERQAWFRRHFARIHILRALAHADNGNDVIMHQVGQADSSSEEDDVGQDVEESDGEYLPLEDTDEE